LDKLNRDEFTNSSIDKIYDLLELIVEYRAIQDEHIFSTIFHPEENRISAGGGTSFNYQSITRDFTDAAGKSFIAKECPGDFESLI
jgi:hypothetical protein